MRAFILEHGSALWKAILVLSVIAALAILWVRRSRAKRAAAEKTARLNRQRARRRKL